MITSKSIIFFLILLLGNYLLPVWGQKMKIVSVTLQPSDLTAIEDVCLDNNRDTCALIKIKTDNLDDIHFPNRNQYVKVSYSSGLYMIYVPSLSRKLDMIHKDYMPIQLDMADFGYKRLRKGKTYLVVLDAPRKIDLESSLMIKVEPKQSKLIIDEKEYVTNSKGTFELNLPPGRHVYTVTCPDFVSKNGLIQIGKAEAKTLSVRLQPIMHEVLVRSNIGNARVYVDNIDYGRVGKMMLPQGMHNIRVQIEGYVDQEKDVLIADAMKPLYFGLKKNRKEIHVHATAITIFANSSRIYKNNKKIKGWFNGKTVMIMPGKYLISDDKGNTKKIVVGTEPMEVRL